MKSTQILLISVVLAVLAGCAARQPEPTVAAQSQYRVENLTESIGEGIAELQKKR